MQILIGLYGAAQIESSLRNESPMNMEHFGPWPIYLNNMNLHTWKKGWHQNTTHNGFPRIIKERLESWFPIRGSCTIGSVVNDFSQQMLDMLFHWQAPSRAQSCSDEPVPPMTGRWSMLRSTLDWSWPSLLCCEIEPEWLGTAAGAADSGVGKAVGIISSNSVSMSSFSSASDLLSPRWGWTG